MGDFGGDAVEAAFTARQYVPPKRPAGKMLPGSTALSAKGRAQQEQQKRFIVDLARQAAVQGALAQVPRRSRTRHLSPSARRDWSDPLLGGEAREKERWYEQRSMSKSTSRLGGAATDVSKLDVSRPLTCLSQTLKGAKVLGAETPFFGSKIDPGPPVWSTVPRQVPPALRLQLERSGNWPLPDTPRCAAMLLAEKAAREAAEEKRRRLAEMEAAYQAKVRARKSVVAVMATTGIVQVHGGETPPPAKKRVSLEAPRPAADDGDGDRPGTAATDASDASGDDAVSPERKASALKGLAAASPGKTSPLPPQLPFPLPRPSRDRTPRSGRARRS